MRPETLSLELRACRSAGFEAKFLERLAVSGQSSTDPQHPKTSMTISLRFVSILSLYVKSLRPHIVLQAVEQLKIITFPIELEHGQ